MGIGGWLTWEAAARIVHNRTGYRTLIHHRGLKNTPVTNFIFERSPFVVTEPLEDLLDAHSIDITNPLANYCKLDAPDYAIHKDDGRHMISIVADAIMGSKIRSFYIPEEIYCNLYIEDSKIETTKNRLANDYGTPVVAIEPNSKTNYTVNRAYPLEKWEYVCEKIRAQGAAVVQVGKGPYLLKNIDHSFVNQTDFINATKIIAACDAFMSSEGGLVHAASNYRHSIVVQTSYNPKPMVEYPFNKNIWIGNHNPCGMKVECNKCTAEASAHDPIEILEALENQLNNATSKE